MSQRKSKKNMTIRLTPEQIKEANQRHDAQFSTVDVKTYKKIKNKFYEKTENGDIDRENLGSGWSKRWQDSWSAKSQDAQNAVLKNQIRIKKIGKK